MTASERSFALQLKLFAFMRIKKNNSFENLQNEGARDRSVLLEFHTARCNMCTLRQAKEFLYKKKQEVDSDELQDA